MPKTASVGKGNRHSTADTPRSIGTPGLTIICYNNALGTDGTEVDDSNHI